MLAFGTIPPQLNSEGNKISHNKNFRTYISSIIIIMAYDYPVMQGSWSLFQYKDVVFPV